MTAGRQLGFLWGGVALALVLLSPVAPRIAGLLPACPLKAWIGLPCPTCGSGRAALALGRFDFGAAVAVSPLATAGWLALIAGGLIAGGAAVLGFSLPEPRGAIGWGWRLSIVALLILNWIYLVWAGT